MPDELRMAESVGASVASGTGLSTPIHIPLPTSTLALIKGVDFITAFIPINGSVMGISHNVGATAPGGSAVDFETLVNDPTVWVVAGNLLGSQRWNPPGRFFIAGDQALLVNNASGGENRYQVRLYYELVRVDPKLWALVGRRTRLEVV